MAKERVEITVFASPEAQRSYDTGDEDRIVDTIRNQVLPREKADYRSVKVKVRRKDDGTPDHLVAYMLRKDTYTADVVRVDVNDTYEVTGFHDEYEEMEEDEEEGGGEGLTYPAAVTFDFVATLTPSTSVYSSTIMMVGISPIGVAAIWLWPINRPLSTSK